MLTCTFFGHGDCYDLDEKVLQKAIEALICRGVDTFYVGNHGHFDSLVFHCLLEMEKRYPSISISVVLAYLPTQNPAHDLYHGYSIYPEIEEGLPRFAIERRNEWMIANATYCLTFVNRTYGGAYKFAKRARSKGLIMVNLGSAEL